MNKRTFLGYLVSGGSAAVVDLGIFLLLVAQAIEVPIASMGSFSVAAVWNYLISSRFVFARPLAGRRFVLFVAVAVVGAAVNSMVTWLAVLQGAAPAFAKILGIGTAFLLNYAANSLIVFRPSGPVRGVDRQ